MSLVPLCGGSTCDVYTGQLEWKGRRMKIGLKQLRVFLNWSVNDRETAMKSFHREMKIWSRFNHPNILPFYGFVLIETSRFFLVSPWCDNGNSMEFLGRNPHFGRHKLISQVADALDYLHSGRSGKSYIHGDLKGDNVLISDDGRALLCDFGLARHGDQLTTTMTMTPSHQSALGHVRFSAPELFRNERPTTESDCFAFGCLVIHMYTGYPPYDHLTTDSQVVGAVLAGEKPLRPTSPSVVAAGLDDELWQLVDKCLEHEVSTRPNMNEIFFRLKQHPHYQPFSIAFYEPLEESSCTSPLSDTAESTSEPSKASVLKRRGSSPMSPSERKRSKQREQS
ncbi:hypothetical protein JAAARDRAFT_68522 [Jaapia argillacea MUCL 33604]|uniref:Protein kinase domain-containing protein n=1 Tax=Jaapia argillacea MUCL 33604 TaxID=933084 RepID=A0A067PYK1_9AGAM|nr:hypothetical protein JAAARDRAFT_68522 [Jaapia argillacea MUCL 33604]